MGTLADYENRLAEILVLEGKIANRVWEQAEIATDKTNIPLNEENIKSKAKALAEALIKDFPNGNPVLVGLMDGAGPFAALVCEALKARNYKFNYATMAVGSYGKEMVSGEVKMGNLPKIDLIGRNVIVLDDVIDTGKTLKLIRDTFLAQYPLCVKLMALVDKQQERPDGCEADYVGFELSKDKFIVGFGLDFDHELRDKSEIRNVDLKSLATAEERLLLDSKEEIIKHIHAIHANKKAEKLLTTGTQSIFTTAWSAIEAVAEVLNINTPSNG